MIFVDLGLFRSDALERLLESVERSGASMLACAQFSSVSVSRLLKLVQRTPVTTIVWHADSMSMLAMQLGQLPRVAMNSQLLRFLAPKLLRLPESIRNLCAVEICGPNNTGLRLDAARSVHLSVKTIGRSLSRVGLPMATALRRRACIALAWDYLHDEKLSLSAVAAMCGFGSERTLSETFRATFGAPPRRARRLISTSGALRALLPPHPCQDSCLIMWNVRFLPFLSPRVGWRFDCGVRPS